MKEIHVTRHAVEQAEQRFCELHQSVDVPELIREEVAEALRAGRVFDHRPDGFLLYGQKKRAVPSGHHVLLSEDGLRGYIVAPPRGGGKGHVVVTALSRAGVARRAQRRPTQERRVA